MSARFPWRNEAGRALIGRRGRQPVRQVDARRRRIAPDRVRRGGDLQRGVPVLRQAAPRQGDRRSDHLGQRQPAPLPMHVVVAGDRGRDRDRQRAVDVDVALDFRPREQVRRHAAGQPIARGVRRRGRARAEIHHIGALLAGAVHQREADAAKPGVPWLVRGKRQRGRHRGVDRIAAGVQHGNARLGCALGLRHHDAAPTGRRRLRELPVLRDVGRRGVLHWRNSSNSLAGCSAAEALLCKARLRQCVRE